MFSLSIRRILGSHPRHSTRSRRSWSASGIDRLEGRLALSTIVPAPGHRHPAMVSLKSSDFNLKVGTIHLNQNGRDYVSGHVKMDGKFPKAAVLRVRLYWADKNNNLMTVASTQDSTFNAKAQHYGSMGFRFTKSAIKIDSRPARADGIIAVIDPDNTLVETNERDNRFGRVSF